MPNVLLQLDQLKNRAAYAFRHTWLMSISAKRGAESWSARSLGKMAKFINVLLCGQIPDIECSPG